MKDNHKKNIARHFSGQGTEYWRAVYDDSPKSSSLYLAEEMRRRKNCVLQYLRAYARRRSLVVLDCGCGAGGLLDGITGQGHTAIALDMSRDMLNNARQLFGHGIVCLNADVEELPLADNSCDAVVCVGVLQYLASDLPAIRELSRVLRDGGMIIITIPGFLRINTMLDPYYYVCRLTRYIYVKIKKTFRGTRAAPGPKDFSGNTDFSNRRYHYTQLNRAFHKCGLVREHTTAVGFGPLTFWRRPLLPSQCSRTINTCLENMTAQKRFGMLKIFANRWIICLKKR